MRNWTSKCLIWLGFGIVVKRKAGNTIGMGIACGVALSGKKRVLGFVQTGTENEHALSPFLRTDRRKQAMHARA